jgi:hypothetical protein
VGRWEASRSTTSTPRSTRARPLCTAILYGDRLAAPAFRTLHSYLLGLAAAPAPRVEHVFRPAPLPRGAPEAARSFLSGYGVALDLKKMEYLAVDDLQARGSRRSLTETQRTARRWTARRPAMSSSTSAVWLNGALLADTDASPFACVALSYSVE